MIKIFAYQNAQGTKSVKILGEVATFDSYFSGISLGKVIFNSPHTLPDVLESLRNFEVLSSRPGRGEGLTNYNDCYKMFKQGMVYCNIATIDPSKIDALELESAIKALKDLNPEESKLFINSLDEGSNAISQSSLALLPDEVIELISKGSSNPDEAARAEEVLSSAGFF